MQPFPTLSRITADVQDDVLVLRVLRSQMLDDRADELRREFAAAIEGHKPAWVVLDMSQVSMISSMGVGVVIGLLRRVRAQGGDLVLCGLSKLVEQVFRLCRLISDDDQEAGAFRTYPDVDRAIAARKGSR
jgi:anti-anti-sigma factor